MLKPHIISTITVIIFAVSGYCFLNAYTDYRTAKKNIHILKQQEQFFKFQISELTKKNRVITDADQFVKKAKQTGLVKERWDHFSVNLTDAPISFPEFKEILSQTANSKYYYFTPEKLEIKRSGSSNGIPNTTFISQESPGTNADSHSGESDLKVTLKGLFLVRK